MLALCVLSPGFAAPKPIAKPSTTCSADDDCSLLGRCVDGNCVCNAGWTGAHCSVADLEPLDPTLGYQNDSIASWVSAATRTQVARVTQATLKSHVTVSVVCPSWVRHGTRARPSLHDSTLQYSLRLLR